MIKINPLKRKKDFEQIFKEGEGWRENYLFFKFLPNNLEKNRLGIIVSQKITKKATLRNKIKRQIREIIRSKLKEKERSTSFDMVLVALPGLENKSFWEIKDLINKLFKKTKIIKK